MSFILFIGLLVLAGYFAICLIKDCMNIKQREQQIDSLNVQLEQQVAENERIQAVLDGGDQEGYIERIARDKLGYVKPGEKVYYNVTPQN